MFLQLKVSTITAKLSRYLSLSTWIPIFNMRVPFCGTRVPLAIVTSLSRSTSQTFPINISPYVESAISICTYLRTKHPFCHYKPYKRMSVLHVCVLRNVSIYSESNHIFTIHLETIVKNQHTCVPNKNAFRDFNHTVKANFPLCAN